MMTDEYYVCISHRASGLLVTRCNVCMVSHQVDACNSWFYHFF